MLGTGEQTMKHKCKKTDIKTTEKCELNRDEIIKALECCTETHTCEDCAYDNKQWCVNTAMSNALALIKELTEDNKAWQKQLISTEEKSGKAYYELACEVEDLRAENERLKDTISRLGKNNDELARVLPLAKKEIEVETASEIFEEIEKCLSPYRYPIVAELKKKYTGGE